MIEFHNNDMKVVPILNESIDLILTDPPYNISRTGANPVWTDPKTGKDKNRIHSQKFSESFEEKWDDMTHDAFLKELSEWSNKWAASLRKGGAFAIFISDQYLSYLWHIMEAAGLEPKRVITWKKPAAVPFNRAVNPVSGCEYILFGIKPGGGRIFNSDTVLGNLVDRYAVADKTASIVHKAMKDNFTKKPIKDIFDDAYQEAKTMIDNRKAINCKIMAVIPNTITFSGGTSKNKIHPTQKPIEILRYFIELLTNPDDLVLDTFAGSGSTGQACKTSGRRCILIERDTQMFSQMKSQFQTSTYNSLFI